jgi:muconolactone delta-isomerase
MRLAPFLYRLARTVNTGEAIASGDPKRIARRAKNIAVGRALGRGGIWRRLWR